MMVGLTIVILDLIASLYESMDILMTPPVPEQYLNITNHNDELNEDALFKMINQLDINNPTVSSSNSNNNKNGSNSGSGGNKYNSSSDHNSTNSSSLMKLQEAISTKLFMVLW